MLDSQEDGLNAEMQTEPTAVGEMQSDLQSQPPKGSPGSSDLQASDIVNQMDGESSLETNLEESFKVDCSLPMDSLLSPFNIIDQLRKHSEVKDLLDLGDHSYFGKYELPLSLKSECSEESQVTIPYFIPELEMACAGEEIERELEVALAEIENPTEPEIERLEIEPIKELNIPGITETHFTGIEEPKLEGLNLPESEKIKSPTIEGPNLKGKEEIEKPKPEIIEKLLCSAELKPISVDILAPKTLQIEELIAPLVENPKPKLGFISSLIGNKLAWTPSVRHSFGDRVIKRTNKRSREMIQQEASRSLKSLILSLTMLKKLEASYNDNSYKSRLNRFEKVRSSLTFSRVFRQNIFQLTSEVESSKKAIEENSLGCGEPMIRSPSEYREPLPILYRLDASEGLTCNGLSVSKDSVFSEVSESDDSQVQNKLCATKSLREVHGLTRPVADLGDILNSGRVLFSQSVRLFCFNKLKEWKRQGKVRGTPETPHRSPSFSGEGKIEILEHQGSYYIVLHDKVTGELIIHMRVDEKWRIDYMTNSSYSCRWTNINYASSRVGILERIACSFREPSHAAEFVARVRNSAIQSRLDWSS
ncbi:uncharacterized protein Sprn isoform X1 [Drosophila takahashii]|uniref:uncharacterized protein Sprn isoform X1 n=1 Tax=Drosophila takahashii TaxID=29030 RepID=UPI003899127C